MLTVLLAVVTKVSLYSLLLLVALWCWYQLTYWRILRAAAKIPSPLHPLPFIGHAFYTLGGIENMTEIAIRVYESLVSKGWTMTCFWAGPVPLFIVLGAEDIQKVLNSTNTMEKADEYNFVNFIQKGGLLTAPWKVWKVTRRHMEPLFHPRNLKHMVPVFNRLSREMVTALTPHVGDATVDLYDHSLNLSIKSILNFAFSKNIEFDTESEEFKGMRYTLDKVPSMWFQRIALIWLRIEGFFNFLYKTELKKVVNYYENFMKLSFQKALLTNEETTKEITIAARDTDHNSYASHGERINFFDAYKILQRDFPNFTDEDLKAELYTLFNTATDSVGVAAASLLLAVAQYQHIQDKVVTEILSVVGQDGDVTSQDLIKMPYLDQVFQETLRFFNIAAFTGRRVTEDIQLGSYLVPAGATLIVVLGGLHKDPKIFSNPNHFDPDHFSQENRAKREKHQFMPFSSGPRNCIGKRYADLLVKLVVIHMLRKFKLSTNMNIHSFKKKFKINLVSTEGYKISLQSRNR